MKLIVSTALLMMLLFSCSFGQSDSNFKASGKINAQFFVDYFYKEHAEDFTFGNSQYSGVKKDYANFDIRRLFLGYNYDFSQSFTGEIMFSYEGNLDGSGNRGVLLKVADIKWKEIYPHADFIVGLQFTPSFILLSEKVWGYRAIEKTLLDKNRIAVPTDLGAGIQGGFDDEKNFGYDLLYADGTGTKPENDRYKKMYADLWAKFFDKKVILNIYGDISQIREIPQVIYQTTKFFAAYQTVPITVGVEAFIQTESKGAEIQDKNGITDFADAKPFGFSIFTSGQIIERKLNFFARYDSFDPDLDYDPNFSYTSPGYSPAIEHFLTFGLDWTPNPSVHVMPNLWYSNYFNKIRGVAGTEKADYDLVPRVTFSFKY
ncbi:MAG: hypothetical protein Q8916_02565 [Bacteroidota bacterium]|nr:hypothetical protein [Bacteroidota bacterium]MDP4229270.1 hypothetical protein [Bacteroidota bacterium]MDP4235789.1 hypothetical protein [Bacteroidota bacterium]